MAGCVDDLKHLPWEMGMKKKKLVWVMGVASVLAAGIVVNTQLSHKNYKQPTPEQVAAAKQAQADAIAEMKEKDRILKQPVCDEPITVTNADMTLVMPRGWATEFRTKDGKELKYIDHRCDIKRIDDVIFIRWLNMSLTYLSTDKEKSKFETYYQRYISKIEVLRAQGLSRMLPNGVEEIKNGYQYFFVFSPSLIPTANNEPVVFDCGSIYGDQLYAPGSCSTSYLYKHNLGFGYRYFGLRNSKTLQTSTVPDFGLYDQLKADKYKRSFLETWI